MKTIILSSMMLTVGFAFMVYHPTPKAHVQIQLESYETSGLVIEYERD